MYEMQEPKHGKQHGKSRLKVMVYRMFLTDVDFSNLNLMDFYGVSVNGGLGAVNFVANPPKV